VNIPNIITVFRIFLVPVVVWLIISGQLQWAFFVFALAGISDGLDGYLAKRFGWTTELGAYLDPLADKLLLVSIYVVLGLADHLPVWLVIAVVSRDVLIVGAVLLSWILGRPVEMRPLLISKANTVCQIMLAALVLVDLGLSLGWEALTAQLIWVTGTLTILSAALYLHTWLRQMSDLESEAKPAPRPAYRAERDKAARRRAKEQATGS
jgi:cardiolipin synthase